MIFKTKHIASQFLMQSLLAFIIIGILVVLFLFSSKKKEEINNAIRLSENISVQINNIDYNLQLALLEQKTEVDFVQVLSDQLINDHNKLVSALIDTLNLLNEVSYLGHIHNTSHLIDSLSVHIKKYAQAYRLCLYSLKEKGNKSGGITQDVSKLTTQMLNELKAVPDNGVKRSEFQDVSSTYFNTYSLGILQSFIEFCEDVSTSFYEFEDFDPYAIEQVASLLSDQLKGIEAIEKRLNGDIHYQGQIKDVEEAMINCQLIDQKLYTQVHERSDSYIKWWNRIIMIVSLILISIIIYSLLKLSKITRKSISNLLSSSESFSNGDVHQTIQTDQNAEFGLIVDHLISHNKHLVNRTNFISELLEDKLNREIEVASKKDHLGILLNKLKDKLQKAQQEQSQRAHENEIRRYINEGLAKFADIMRLNSNNTQALGDNLIKNLTKYLNALQGMIFLTDEENGNELQLIAAFAFDRKKYMTKTIKIGEGLIGTCANEKKTIYLKKVPDDYARITSGMGDTPPNKVLIVPVMHEKDLVGVIELASLNELKPFEIELIEQIATSLASTIITVRNNTKTAQLLEKSQHQAAEMAEQEEEMRQNMEELKATQEESGRREEEMQGILNAVGSIFYILEYDHKGKIVHVNDRMVSFLEQPYDSFIGKSHNEVFSSESKLNDEFFVQVTNEKNNQNVSEILSWGSKKYKYTYAISPIISRYDEVIKILNLITIDELIEQ